MAFKAEVEDHFRTVEDLFSSDVELVQEIDLSNQPRAHVKIENPFPSSFDFNDGKRAVLRLNPVRI